MSLGARKASSRNTTHATWRRAGYRLEFKVVRAVMDQQESGTRALETEGWVMGNAITPAWQLICRVAWLPLLLSHDPSGLIAERELTRVLAGQGSIMRLPSIWSWSCELQRPIRAKPVVGGLSKGRDDRFGGRAGSVRSSQCSAIRLHVIKKRYALDTKSGSMRAEWRERCFWTRQPGTAQSGEARSPRMKRRRGKATFG